MNNGPNSDSEQSTESKLGRVYSEHTHGPSYACTAPWPRAGRRVVARRAPYRGAVSQVASCCITPSPVAIQNCIVTPSPMLCALRVVSRAHSAVSSAVSRAISRPKRSPPATIQNFYRDSPPAARLRTRTRRSPRV